MLIKKKHKQMEDINNDNQGIESKYALSHDMSTIKMKHHHKQIDNLLGFTIMEDIKPNV